MKTTQVPGSRPIHVWTDDVEDSARRQLDNMAKLPFLHPHGIAVMPDVHAGIGLDGGHRHRHAQGDHPGRGAVSTSGAA